MARASTKVFLGVHGVESEQATGQAQRRNHLLGGGNLVALLCNRQMAENDLAVGGKGAQHVRRLAVVKSVEAAAQGLTVDRHAGRCHAGRNGPLFSQRRKQPGRVLAENPLDLRRIETMQDEPHRRVGWNPPQRYPERGIQAVKMCTNESMDLTIRPRSGQHRQHREQQDRRQGIDLSLATTGIGNLGKQRQQHTRHLGNPRKWLPPIDSDKTPLGNPLFALSPTRHGCHTCQR